MSSNALVPCPDCGHRVSHLAEACPSCGRPLRKPVPREGLLLRTLNQLLSASVWLLLLLFLVPIAAALVGILLTRH
jgi:predicted amidophosphoribosyltransferase